MSPEPVLTATPGESPAELRARRRQVLATTALLWPGFSVLAWALHRKFWHAFATEEIPVFSRTLFSVPPLIVSVIMLGGIGLWAALHLRTRSATVRRGLGLVALGLWCTAAGLLCLAFLAPLLGLRVNL